MAIGTFNTSGVATAASTTTTGSPNIHVSNLSNKSVTFTVTGNTNTFNLPAGAGLLVTSVGGAGAKTVTATARHGIGQVSDFGGRGYISVLAETAATNYSIPARFTDN